MDGLGGIALRAYGLRGMTLGAWPCPWGCGLGNMQALLGLGGLEALGVLRPLGGLEASWGA